jgi:phosphoglycolate phosphatase
MKVSAVVFDFDGTLVESNALKRQGFFDLVAEHADGTARMHQILANVVGDRCSVLSAYAELCAQAGVVCADLGTLVQRYSAQVDAGVTAAPEIAGATEIIRRLRTAGCHIYLSSATPLPNLKAILQRRRWETWFNGVFGHPAKKSETLLRIQAQLGLTPQQMAVVGDGIDDRDSARKLGCAFFPVGEARGLRAHERAYTLAEVAEVLLSSTPTPS